MRLPKFCYEKAFWVIVPILIVSIGSGIAAINAQIEYLDNRVTQNQVEIALNNVPELKTTIDKRFDNIEQKLDSIEFGQSEIKAQNKVIIKLSCMTNELLC